MPPIFLNVSEPQNAYKGPSLFAAGHRPFFLMAGLSAVVLILMWLHAYMAGTGLSSSWHGHEMVFGFASSAIAGFLMAAVPKWTNSESPIGWMLAGIVSLWLLGRIGFYIAAISPEFEPLAFADLIFLPVIFTVTAKMIMGAKNTRNYIVLFILSLLMVSNFAYHFYDAHSALRAGIYSVLMLAALIGGRVIPAFTQNALSMKLGKAVSCTTPVWTHKAILILMSAMVVGTLLGMPDLWSGLLSLAIAVVLFIRMLDWKSLNSFFDPIVWVLHAAYIWLPIGFALKALSDLFGVVEANMALHALTVGGIGMLILAIASRAALGHSGRELKVSRITVVAYLLVSAATILRVLALDPVLISISGGLWVLGYGLFGLVYIPILLKRRVDGLPG